MMRRRFFYLFLMVSLLFGCVTTPFTEQRSLPLVPFSKEVKLGEEAYREILKKEKISQDRPLIEIMERVGQQLAAVSSMPNLDWEFTLIESDKQNAFALPGGKVAIYTGILPVCANEAGLAAVMGHQIAHTIARHGAQRMSQTVLPGGIPAASVSLSDHKHREVILGAMGVGTTVGITPPFSRSNESEADGIGLHLMAKAGYDPREAERFWGRFHKMNQGKQAPELLSTHPTDATRIQDLRRLLPEAIRIYKANPLQHGLGRSFLVLMNQRKLIPGGDSQGDSPARNAAPKTVSP